MKIDIGTTDVSRRVFMKGAASMAAAAGIGASGVPLWADEKASWKWHKGACRFCGVGCGLQVATEAGKVVAVKGDPENPVNRGLLCVKGYANAQIPYGADRLTRPLLRMKNGKFDKRGDFVPVSWDVALDEMERQFKRAYAELGPTGVAVMGSGQYTIQEGYAAVKLVKGGWRSNNIDPNARHCMASAVAAFIQTFGIDEPAGAYDDIELTDTLVLWGANMAEMHPILWSRVTDSRMKQDGKRIFNLTTYENRCSDFADTDIVFKPNTDLAILNFIAREIVTKGGMDEAFVEKHCIFATGPYDIGYGLRADDDRAYAGEEDTLLREREVELTAAEMKAQRKTGQPSKVEQGNTDSAGKHWQITFEEFRRGLEPYTLDFVAKLARGDSNESLGTFKKKLQALADQYVARDRKVVSYWTMGFNQHVRGTWVNEQAYMVHLLTGKQAKPGNGAFSLTGQPSACGTAREVGTFAHRLPADMVVANPKHRARTEELWKLPSGTLNPKVGSHITKMMRDLEDGTIRWLWTQVTNPFQSTANANHWITAAREMDNFIVVSDVYPTLSCEVADLILPSAIIFEKWGAYGNSERRTQAWRQMVDPPGEAHSDVWQMLEFSKRFTLAEVWGRQRVPGVGSDHLPDVLAAAAAMGYEPSDTLYDVLYATPAAKQHAWPDPVARGQPNCTVSAAGIEWFPEKALFQEYVQFGRGHHHDLADYDVYLRDDVRGLRWPVHDGDKETVWRFNEKYDRYAKKGSGFDFYGGALKAIPGGDLDGVTDPAPQPLAGKAKIFFRPYAAPAESPDENYDMWLCTGRVLEHWHSGSMTRRVPSLHRAVPTAHLYMNADDAEERDLWEGDLAYIESRRGRIAARVLTEGRNRMPPGTVFLPWFDEGVFVNKLTLDATCPISKETDFKKCAVKVYACTDVVETAGGTK